MTSWERLVGLLIVSIAGQSAAVVSAHGDGIAGPVVRPDRPSTPYASEGPPVDGRRCSLGTTTRWHYCSRKTSDPE